LQVVATGKNLPEFLNFIVYYFSMSYIESNNRAVPRKPEKISSTIMKPLELLKRFLFA